MFFLHIYDWISKDLSFHWPGGAQQSVQSRSIFILFYIMVCLLGDKVLPADNKVSWVEVEFNVWKIRGRMAEHYSWAEKIKTEGQKMKR